MSKALSLLSFFWERRSLWATIFFVAVVGFLDENSFMNLFEQCSVNAALKTQIAAYEQEYDDASNRLQELNLSQSAVEEVARVNLLMKSDDEDIYIVE